MVERSENAKSGRYFNNRLQQLRGFCYAAQAGSISRAADRLSLSQPSVSLQIQALERELETTLFERRGPKINLTPEGQLLYQLAQPMIASIEALPDTFHAHRGIERGNLDIAAGESTLLYLLPKFIKELVDSYPGIELKLHNVTGRDGLALVRGDEVDLAVGPMLDTPEDVDYQAMFTSEPMLITPAGHPLAKKRSVSLEDIAQYQLILPPRRLSTWRMIDTVFQQYDLTCNVRLEAGGWEVVKKYVALGLGVSIVSGVCLSTGGEELAIRPMGKFFPTRTYGIVTRKGRFLSAPAKRFIEIVRRGAAAHSKALIKQAIRSGRQAAGG